MGTVQLLFEVVVRGGGATGSGPDRKCAWPIGLPEVTEGHTMDTQPGSLLTGSWGFPPFLSDMLCSTPRHCVEFLRVHLITQFSPYFFHILFFFFGFPRFFSYYDSSTVVQVLWLLEVTKGHVTPKGWKDVPMRNRKLGFPAFFSVVFGYIV